MHYCRWISTFRANPFLKPPGLYKGTTIVFPHSSTLKMKAGSPSETVAPTITTTRHHSPEGQNMKSHGYGNSMSHICFHIPKSIVIERTAFCDVTPCSAVKVHRRFGRSYCHFLRCQRVSQASNQQDLVRRRLRASLTLRPCRWH